MKEKIGSWNMVVSWNFEPLETLALDPSSRNGFLRFENGQKVGSLHRPVALMAWKLPPTTEVIKLLQTCLFEV